MKIEPNEEKQNRISKQMSHQDSISTAPNSNIGACILSKMPRDYPCFFSNLNKDESIFEKMNKLSHPSTKPSKFLAKIKSPKLKKKPYHIKRNSKISSIEDMLQQPNTKTKAAKVTSQKLPDKNLTLKELSYIHSECSEKDINFTLSSFNFPDTEEIAKEEDRFWKDERKDPIIGKIFGEDGIQDRLRKDNSAEFSTMEEAVGPCGRRSKGGKGRRNRLTSILKLNPQDPNLEKNGDGRRVSFNGRIKVKLISRNERKSGYFN